MGFEIRLMTPDDYDEAVALWNRSEGIGMGEADSRANFERYLSRNPGLSLVAVRGEQLAGAVLCGHDGRRGFLHHLAVDPAHVRSGVGRALAARCLELLKAEQIDKCHIFVWNTNETALRFWEATGWFRRHELTTLSKLTTEGSDDHVPAD